MTGEVNLKIKAGFFVTQDGLSLYDEATLPEFSVASVVFVHGLGEHIGRYTQTFQDFTVQGYQCFGFDQRGFGRSGGDRGHIRQFSDYVDDLALFINQIRLLNVDKPIILLGHSMGSIVALAYAIRHPKVLKALLIFSSPIQLPSIFAKIGSFLAQLLAPIIPNLKIPNLIDSRDLSNNFENRQRFSNDPLAYQKVSLNWLSQFTQARHQVLRQAARIEIPVLINHGAEDRIAAPAGAKLLREELGSDDKILNIYTGLKHELLNHLPQERKEVLDKTFLWLDRVLS